MPAPAAHRPPMTDRRRAVYMMAALLAVVVALYAPVFRFEFIDFDDGRHVTSNPCVVAGLSWFSIRWAFTHFFASQWIPLTWISYMIDVKLFGFDPGWMHLGNVALHALNACLVFAALRRLTKEFWPSAVVAALFAVHPLNVESVAWIAERKNVLSTFFGLLALWAYARHAEQPARRGMWAVAGCMALGLLAKPMLVTLPFALLLLDVWPLRRTETTSWGRLVGEKSVLFLLTAAASATTLAASAHQDALISGAVLSLPGRAANGLIGYAAYLGKLFWPVDLAVLYPLQTAHPAAPVLGAIALLGALTVGCVIFRKSHPFLLVGWLWFLGILVPVSSIFQVGTQAYADRFTYLPQLGIFWGVVWAGRALPRPWARWGPLAAGGGVAILAMLTVQQVSYWKDTSTLFEHDLRVTPNNGVAQSIAGMGAVRHGDYPRAIAHYREAKRLLPYTSEVRALLAEALTHTGENAEALEQLQAAVALDPKNDHARRNLITMLLNQGRREEAGKLIPH